MVWLTVLLKEHRVRRRRIVGIILRQKLILKLNMTWIRAVVPNQVPRVPLGPLEESPISEFDVSLLVNWAEGYRQIVIEPRKSAVNKKRVDNHWIRLCKSESRQIGTICSAE